MYKNKYKKIALLRLQTFLSALVLLTVLAGCGGGGGDGSGGGTGSSSLTWDAPTHNTDNSLLTDLSGYNVYYGTSSGVYSISVNVGNVTSTTIEGLVSGTTYYVVVTAYDFSGNESAYSNEIVKVAA